MSESKSVAPTRGQFTPLGQVATLNELLVHPQFSQRIAKAAGRHFNADRLISTFSLAVRKVPKLADVDPMSYMGACTTLAYLNLEPNSPLGFAHLIPFEVTKWNPQTREREYVRTDVQVILGYQGLAQLASNAPALLDFHCDLVWKDEEDNGLFSFEYGSKKHLTHRPHRIRRPETEEPVYAYCHWRLKSGGEDFMVFPLAELHRHRSHSQGFRTAMYAYDEAISKNKDPNKDKRYADSPWIKFRTQMYLKTALRGSFNWMPKSVQGAYGMVIEGEYEKIDFAKLGKNVVETSPESVRYEDVESMIDDSVVAADEDDEDPTSSPQEARTAAPAAARPAPPAKSPAPPQQSAQGAAAPNDGWMLYNAFGEPEAEEPITDPVKWAQGFERLYAGLGQNDQANLLEHNAEVYQFVASASPAAAKILAPPEKSAEERLYIPNSKTQAGTLDLRAYIAAARALIASVNSVADLRALERINADAIKALSAKAREAFDAAFNDRLNALAPPIDDEIPAFATEDVPAPGEEMSQNAPSSDAEKRDTRSSEGRGFNEMDRWAADIQGYYEGAASLDDLRASRSNSAVASQIRQMEQKRPDLARTLAAAYDANVERLKS